MRPVLSHRWDTCINKVMLYHFKSKLLANYI
jgi:hypothetical protein